MRLHSNAVEFHGDHIILADQSSSSDGIQIFVATLTGRTIPIEVRAGDIIDLAELKYEDDSDVFQQCQGCEKNLFVSLREAEAGQAYYDFNGFLCQDCAPVCARCSRKVQGAFCDQTDPWTDLCPECYNITESGSQSEVIQPELEDLNVVQTQ